MAFAEDLLEQAYHLANMDTGTPKQANLRRAVSTAYYALFHLLIDEAVGNWNIARQRSILARTFDHAKMKAVCRDHKDRFFSAGQPSAGVPLKNVASALSDLQENRHTADYDNGVHWSRIDALNQIDDARDAFADWQAIRATGAAQDFLLQLSLPKIPRT
jgi:uncharacterized protein (UPF0332 family)